MLPVSASLIREMIDQQGQHPYDSKLFLLLHKLGEDIISIAIPLNRDRGCRDMPGAYMEQIGDLFLKISKANYVIEGIGLVANNFIHTWLKRRNLRWSYIVETVQPRLVAYAEGGFFSNHAPFLLIHPDGLINWYTEDIMDSSGYLPQPVNIIRDDE